METQNSESTEQESYLDHIVNEPIRVTKNIRFVNYIIDLLVVYALIFLFGITLGATGNSDILQSTLLTRVISFVIYFIYYFVMEISSGRTIGKLFTGCKVITTDGNKPTSKQIALRSLSRLVPFDAFSFLGNEGWHDRWTDTMVVKNK